MGGTAPPALTEKLDLVKLLLGAPQSESTAATTEGLRLRKAYSLLEARKFEEAIALLDEFLKSMPQSAQAHLCKAAASYSLGRYGVAIKECEESERIDNSDERIHL